MRLIGKRQSYGVVGQIPAGGWLHRALATSAVLLALSAQIPAAAQVSVTESGTAAYSLPIGVPPGISGMSPNIGLSYTGSGVNGPVGFGWSIQGVSVITRCPQTRAIDGFSRTVRFSTDDKLCLDGQRLIQVDATGAVVNGGVVNPGPSNVFQSADSLGGTGAAAVREYRTEKDSYVRVRAYESASDVPANGPKYFKVWTKSGQIYEYGNKSNSTANSAINAQGKTIITAWAVSRISDTLGNYVDFQYEQRDTAWGSGPSSGIAGLLPIPGHEWNLLEIRYTGNGSQLPANKIVFTYADRATTAASGPPQDRAEAYALGSKNVSIRRLNSIRTYVNSPNPGTLGPGGSAVKVKSVKLTYDNGPITNRSRVTRIAECAGAAETACMPATVFTYAAGANDAFQANASFAAGGLRLVSMTNSAGSTGVLPLDFDGDGKTDLLRWSDTPSQNLLYKSVGDGSFAQVPNGSGAGQFNIQSDNLYKSDGCFTTLPIDINGDGLVDLFRFSASISPISVACPSPPPLIIFKNNGNGSFGTFTYSGPTLERRISNFTVCTPVMIGNHACLHNYWTRGANFFLMDVDGDGLPDLVTTVLPALTANDDATEQDPCLTTICTRVYKGDGLGTFTEISTDLAHVSVYNDPPRGAGLDAPKNLVDIDGDGLVDIVGLPVKWWPATNVAAFRSRGDGNFDATAVGVSCSYPLDFNGDGRADCLTPGVNGTVAQNYLSVATGGTAPFQGVAGFNLKSVGNELTAADAGFAIVDINGDGRSDILRWKNDPTATKLYLSNGDGTFSTSAYFNLTSATTQLKSSDYSTDFVVGDFTGRGSAEILRLRASPSSGEATSNQLYEKSDKTPPDQLVSVTTPTGLTTQLTWVPMNNSVSGSLGARYVSDRGVVGQAASFPKVDVSMPAYVIATSEAATGVGSATLKTEYAYKGLKAAFDGRGMRGFRETRRQTKAPNNSDLTVVTQYLQDHPYIGVASSSQTFVGSLDSTPGNLLSRTTNVYCDKTSAPGAEATALSTGVPCPVSAKVQRPYLVKTKEEGWDPGNYVALPSVTTTNTFNNSGDPATILVSTAGTALGIAQEFTKTTTNTYFPDVTTGDSWVLGRLQQATQRNIAPNSLASIATSPGTAPGASAIQGTGQTQFATLSNVSFGTVTATASSTLTSTLTNTGALPLTITTPVAGSVTGAGFSFASTSCGTVLAAYASCTVSVTFAPVSASPYSGSLSVVTGAGTLTGSLSGTGIGPSVVFQPVSTNWGTVGAASDSGDWPQIKNNSAVAVLITAHSVASGPAGVWSWQGTTNNCIPGTTVLQPGASCQTFFGTGTLSMPGSYSATDQISYQVVGGSGATFTTQQSYAFSIATTTANSSGLTFGNVPPNTTSAAQSFVLTNNAVNGGSLKNLSISMVGSQPANFPMTHNCGTAIAQGASCTVTVSFNPTWIANGFSAGVQIQGGYSRMQGGVDTGATQYTGVNFNVAVSGNGQGSIATLTTPPALVVPTTWYGGGSQTVTATYRNDGNSAMTLNTPALAAPLSVTFNACTGVAPGSSCSMIVTAGTNVAGLSQSQTFTPTGAATAPAATTVTWTTQTAVPRWNPTSLNFGSLVAGGSTSQNITLYNDGNVAYNWAANNAIANQPGGYSFNTAACSNVAAGGGACTVSVTFTPPGVATYAGSNISMSAASYNTNTFSVTGIGLGTPTLAVSPSPVNMGSFAKSQVRSTVVTLTNSGTGAANSLSYVFAYAPGDTLDGYYRSGGTCPAAGGSLASGSSCTLIVSFQAPCISGPKNSTMTIAGSNFTSVVTNLTATVTNSGVCTLFAPPPASV